MQVIVPRFPLVNHGGIGRSLNRCVPLRSRHSLSASYDPGREWLKRCESQSPYFEPS
jgi:hypothetical protein